VADAELRARADGITTSIRRRASESRNQQGGASQLEVLRGGLLEEEVAMNEKFEFFQ
jgi:ATP-dependent Zn protease